MQAVKKLMIISQPSTHQIFHAGRDVINMMHPPHHTALSVGERLFICSGEFDPMYINRDGSIDWDKVFLSYEELNLPIPNRDEFDIGFVNGVAVFNGCVIYARSIWAIDYEFHHWMVSPIKVITPKIPIKTVYKNKVRSAQYVLNCNFIIE